MARAEPPSLGKRGSVLVGPLQTKTADRDRVGPARILRELKRLQWPGPRTSTTSSSPPGIEEAEAPPGIRRGGRGIVGEMRSCQGEKLPLARSAWAFTPYARTRSPQEEPATSLRSRLSAAAPGPGHGAREVLLERGESPA